MQTDRQTYRQTRRQTDRRTDRQTDRQTDVRSSELAIWDGWRRPPSTCEVAGSSSRVLPTWRPSLTGLAHAVCTSGQPRPGQRLAYGAFMAKHLMRRGGGGRGEGGRRLNVCAVCYLGKATTACKSSAILTQSYTGCTLGLLVFPLSTEL